MNRNERPLTQEERRLGELVRQTIKDGGGDPDAPFRPFAVYHEDLEFILVMTRDCSYTEHRINDGLCLLEDNHPEDSEDKYVGFEIWATPGFYKHEELLRDGCVELNQILDAVAKLFPGNLLEVEICRSLLGKLETTTVRIA